MSLASNQPLRLPLLTAAEVRAAARCPTCGAEPGRPCRALPGGNQPPMTRNHLARIALARRDLPKP